MPDILLISVDNWQTGERGGGLIDIDDLRNGNLVSPGGKMYQRLDHEPGGDYELRIVKDGRDISQYNGTWTITFDDSTTATTLVQLQSGILAGKYIVNIDGVVPIPNKHLDKAKQLLPKAFLPRYNIMAEPKDIVDWCQENNVVLTGTRWEKIEQAYDAGCPYVDKTDVVDLL